MAAILKLRRGTSFTSLQESELFYNTSLETIVIGDGSGSNTSSKILVKLNESNSGSLHLLSDITGSHISASGDIYASSIETTGDATIGGNIVLAGNIFLGDGDNSSDNVSINSSFSGSFLPTADAVFTLGTPSKRYLDIRVVSASIESISLPGSTILSSSVTNFTNYSQSVDSRLDIEEVKSVILETVTSSLDSRLDVEEAKSVILETVTSSLDSRIGQLETDTGSQDNRLDNLESTTSSLDSRVGQLETDTGSQDGRLDNLELTSASHDSRLDIEEAKSVILETVTSSLDSRLDIEEAKSVILETVTSSLDSRLDQVEVITSSLNSTYESIGNGIVSGSSQVNYSSLSGINNDIVSASTDTNQVDIIINDGSISANLKGGVVSGSIQILGGSTILSSSNETFTTFSSSVDTRLDTIEGPLSTSIDSRLDLLSNVSHSHSNKTQLDNINQNLSTTSDVTFNTGSFTGNVTVTGDLTVLGDATEISTTELRIEDKLITVASGSADSAAADGAGIEIDGAGKSLQWDHNTTSFVLDAKVSSSVGFKGEGGELTGIDTDQVTEAGNLYYTDARVKTKLDAETVISGSSQVTGDLDSRYESIGNGIVSGSSQVDADQTTGWIADVRKQIDNVGLISGSVQVNANTITNFDSNVKTKLDADAVHSGSFLGTSTTANLSENTNLYYTDARVKTKLDAETVISGSSQVTYSSITGIPTTITGGQASAIIANTSKVGYTDALVKLKTDADNVHSGSFLGTSTTSDLTEGTNLYYSETRFSSSLDKRGIISGSTFSSPTQGTVRATINGANTDVDTGLQTGDSPTFTTLTLSSVASGGSSDYDALFNVGGLFKKRTLGTSAFYAVSASIADDPNSVPTTKAVNDALVAAGAGDITAVNSTTTISPTTTGLIHTEEGTSDAGAYGNTGNIVIAIDTGSAHFVNGVSAAGAPSGTVSGSQQVIDHLPTGTVSSSAQLANSTVSNESLNSYSASAITATAVQDSRLGFLSTETGSISTEQGVQDQRLTAIESVSGSFLTGTIDISSGTNLAVSDTTNVDMILTGDTLTANLKGGVISGSSQVDHDSTTNFVANEHIDHSSITLGSGKGLSGGGTIDTNRSLSLDTGSVHFQEGVELVLPAGTVSGSSQVQINSVTGFSAVSTSLDDRIDTLEGDTHENVLTFGDTANIDLIRTTNNITANIKGGIFSGSVQIAAGGDLSGNVDSLTVGSVQGVALTSGEATQIAAIGTNTISATQWGYLGASNQGITTTSDVTFASASLSNVVISGNLTVLGDSVAINVSDLKIEDKLITVASGSTDSATADGAGIEIAGANESITWNHANTRFNISDDIHVTGTIKATDDIIAFSSSDRELKNNILPITSPLEKINKIGGYSFDWNTEKQHIYKGKDYGVIAQEIEKILPELVQTREDGYKAVKYDKLVSLLIEGIKDLSKEVDELKRKIEK